MTLITWIIVGCKYRLQMIKPNLINLINLITDNQVNQVNQVRF